MINPVDMISLISFIHIPEPKSREQSIKSEEKESMNKGRSDKEGFLFSRQGRIG